MTQSSNLSDDLPVILGGAPIFEEKVPIFKPWVPTLDDLSEELSDVLTTGMLTKGKCLAAFEEATAEHLQVKHGTEITKKIG